MCLSHLVRQGCWYHSNRGVFCQQGIWVVEVVPANSRHHTIRHHGDIRRWLCYQADANRSVPLSLVREDWQMWWRTTWERRVRPTGWRLGVAWLMEDTQRVEERYGITTVVSNGTQDIMTSKIPKTFRDRQNKTKEIRKAKEFLSTYIRIND